MQIEFDVDGQRLIRTSEAYIIEGSEFFVECLFSFSSDWDELEKWAIFKRGTDTYEILIVGNRCIVPVECTAVEGEFTISLIGRQSNMFIIATTSEKLLYVRSTSHSNISYFDKAMAYIKEKAEAAAAVLKSVLEAKDHIDKTDYKIYVGETAPTEDITNAMVWINPSEDDSGSDELAEAVDSAQNAANLAEVQANSVKKYKALWFDSVAAMKAEPSLTAGAYVNTAGYYEPNDGGGASYLIREKLETDTDDGGSLHELQNGLVAELIVENGTVNVKQFGAKGDGESHLSNDVEADTKAFKDAISYIISHKEYPPVLYIHSGFYRVTESIRIPNYIRIKAVGKVTILSYTGANPTFLYKTEPDDVSYHPMEDTHGISKNAGCLIDGSNGSILFLNKSNNSSSIAIKLDKPTNPMSAYRNGSTNLCSMSEVYFENYNLGIYIVSNHFYLFSFIGLSFTKCDRNIYFDNDNTSSGERTTFTNCTFSGTDKAVPLIESYMAGDFYFHQCSFDFFYIGFSSNKGMSKYYFTDCHIEGVGFTDGSIAIGDSPCFFFRNGEDDSRESYCIIKNCTFSKSLDTFIKSNKKNTLIVDIDSLLCLNTHVNKPNSSYYICDENCVIQKCKLNYTTYGTLIPAKQLNCLEDSNFSTISEQQITAGTATQGIFRFMNVLPEITTEQFNENGKSAKYVCTEHSYPRISLVNTRECKAGQVVYVGYKLYIDGSNSAVIPDEGVYDAKNVARITFYDKDDNVVDSAISSKYDNRTNLVPAIANMWHRPHHIAMAFTPPKAVKYSVDWMFNCCERGANVTFYVTDLFVCEI